MGHIAYKGVARPNSLGCRTWDVVLEYVLMPGDVTFYWALPQPGAAIVLPLTTVQSEYASVTSAARGRCLSSARQQAAPYSPARTGMKLVVGRAADTWTKRRNDVHKFSQGRIGRSEIARYLFMI